jgi:hypothetical protein
MGRELAFAVTASPAALKFPATLPKISCNSVLILPAAVLQLLFVPHISIPQFFLELIHVYDQTHTA